MKQNNLCNYFKDMNASAMPQEGATTGVNIGRWQWCQWSFLRAAKAFLV